VLLIIGFCAGGADGSTISNLQIQAMVRAGQTSLNIRTNHELFIINLAAVMGRRNSYPPPAQSHARYTVFEPNEEKRM